MLPVLQQPIRRRLLSSMPGTIEVKKKFLSSPKYAVVGASKDQTKFGTKVRQLPQYESIIFSTIRLGAKMVQSS